MVKKLHRRTDQRSHPGGFTLIELLMTVLIIAVLASVALPLTHLAAQRSKEAQLRDALHQIREGIDAYKRAADSGHIVLTSGESGYPPSLEVLVSGVVDAKPDGPSVPGAIDAAVSPGAKLYFLRRIPRDPMNEELDVPAADTWGKRSYASSYENPQEGVDVFDVYSLSSKVGLNKQPYREW